MSSYDSRPDTHEHIAQVRGLLLGVVQDLLERAHRHDRSKLAEPELTGFDVATPKLKGLTYNSPEYHQATDELGVALDHHYAVNDHHPQHFPGGIADMDLIQLTELLCDWLAASRRHEDGDVRRSIEQNAERFGYGEDWKRLLLNTLDRIEEREVSLS